MHANIFLFALPEVLSLEEILPSPVHSNIIFCRNFASRQIWRKLL